MVSPVGRSSSSYSRLGQGMTKTSVPLMLCLAWQRGCCCRRRPRLRGGQLPSSGAQDASPCRAHKPPLALAAVASRRPSRHSLPVCAGVGVWVDSVWLRKPRCSFPRPPRPFLPSGQFGASRRARGLRQPWEQQLEAPKLAGGAARPHHTPTFTSSSSSCAGRGCKDRTAPRTNPPYGGPPSVPPLRVVG